MVSNKRHDQSEEFPNTDRENAKQSLWRKLGMEYVR